MSAEFRADAVNKAQSPPSTAYTLVEVFIKRLESVVIDPEEKTKFGFTVFPEVSGRYGFKFRMVSDCPGEAACSPLEFDAQIVGFFETFYEFSAALCTLASNLVGGSQTQARAMILFRSITSWDDLDRSYLTRHRLVKVIHWADMLPISH